MSQIYLSRVRAFFKTLFIKIFSKENKAKVIEFSMLIFLLISSFDKDLLIISIIVFLGAEHILGLMYSKYDTKKKIIQRNILLAVILLISLTKADAKIFIILSTLVYFGNAYFLNIGAANLATSASIASACISIYYSFTENYSVAVLLIVCGAVLDSIDGFIARLFGKGKSEEYKKKGELSDNIGDGTSFGLATSAFIFFNINPYFGTPLSITISTLYCACVFYRLYHFIKTKNNVRKGYFEGLPSPAAALAIGIGGLILNNHTWVFLGLVFMISIAMIYFPLLWVKAAKNKSILFTAFASFILLICGLIKEENMWLLPFFAINIIYALYPFFYWIIKHTKK
jgi:phosphatidylserine synthase